MNIDVAKKTLDDIMPTGPGSKLTKLQLLKLHIHLDNINFAYWAVAPDKDPKTGSFHRPSSREVLQRFTSILQSHFSKKVFASLSPTYIRRLRNAFTKTNLYKRYENKLKWHKSLPRKMQLPAGEWVLTDPCYIIARQEWSDFLTTTLYTRARVWPGYTTELDAEFAELGVEMKKIPDSLDCLGDADYKCTAAIFSTVYGDGSYLGELYSVQHDKTRLFSCGVDAGLLGFVSTDRVKEYGWEDLYGLKFTSDTPVKIEYHYSYITFEYSNNGVVYVGHQKLY